MIRLAAAVVRWVCDPAKLEVLEGDLRELHERRRDAAGAAHAGWRALGDALSICLRHSRLTIPAVRRRLLRLGGAAAAATMLLTGVDPSRARTAAVTYTVNATDPAGSFTLEFDRTRVVRATMDGLPVEPARLVQEGGTLVIRGGDRGRDFRVAIKPGGGIAWTARTR